MQDPESLICPYCGESVEVYVDPGGGDEQSYVEDCPICCRPWHVEIRLDEMAGWSVVLRTADE